MERLLMPKLVEWGQRAERKPLIIMGARQVGKTWLMREFGNTYFKDIFYLNFENTPGMEDLFSGEIRPQRIIDYLSALHGKRITANDTLIIFDEVQEVPRALTSLKYFAEEAPEYAICCAGSFLGIALHKNTSFPVGKVEFLTLEPLSFEEYLMANKEQLLLDQLRSSKIEPIPALFSDKLMDYLKYYFIIGGMPAAVLKWLETRDFHSVESIQSAILTSYEQDFSKHAPTSLVPKIRHIWNSIPAQLARENKKFLYGLAKEGARAREYEDALMWLNDSGLIRQVFRTTQASFPLKAYVDLKSFKIFHLDIGLLRVMSGLSPEIIIEKETVFKEFKGAISEQYVLQQMAAMFEIKGSYYWSTDATAEIDFLFSFSNLIIPIEVKAGENLHAKSLRVYIEKYNPAISIRTSLRNLQYTDGLLNIPLFVFFNLINMISKITDNKN
ncbi:MAG: ATP-binding protein [Bacteroidia bacterium]|nr:ATP-binding protein [Bacteroidia bacterium]